MPVAVAFLRKMKSAFGRWCRYTGGGDLSSVINHSEGVIDN